MKVLGQLEGAQLEQLAANPSTGVATGRMYMNIASPLAAVPYVYNGSSWEPITLGQSSAVISQNSGKAVTVDWSQGVQQLVILTDNCLISFSNPQSGRRHTLTVRQSQYGGSVQYTFVFPLLRQPFGW